MDSSIDVSLTNLTLQCSLTVSKDLSKMVSNSNMGIKPRGILKNSCVTKECDSLSFPCSAKPAEGSNELKMKKSVKFSSHVSCNFFRSNSSILGQRKKNQRKARKKKKSCSSSKYQTFDPANGGSQQSGDSEESSTSEPDSLASSPTTEALLPFHSSHFPFPINSITKCYTMQENAINDNIRFSNEEKNNLAGICEDCDSRVELRDASLVFGKDSPTGIKEYVLSTEAFNNSLMLLTLKEKFFSKHFSGNFCSVNLPKVHEAGLISLFHESKSSHKLCALMENKAEEGGHVKCNKGNHGAIDLSISDGNNSDGDIKMIESPSNLDNENKDRLNNNDMEFSKLETSDDENSIGLTNFTDIEKYCQLYTVDKKSLK